MAKLVRSAARGLAVTTLLACIAALGIAVPGFAFAATAFVALYVLLGIGEPLASDITHRAAQSNERATVLSVQSLTLQLSGVIAALCWGGWPRTSRSSPRSALSLSSSCWVP